LDEKCEAKSNTTASIAGAPHRISPPEGWFYAQLATSTITQPDPAGPVLLVTSFKPESAPAALRKQREERLVALCAIAGLELPPKTTLGPSDSTGEGPLKPLLWQREHIKRGAAEGPLLVFAGQHESVELFGVGFVPATDTSKADEAIEASIQSLRLDAAVAGSPADAAADKDKAP